MSSVSRPGSAEHVWRASAPAFARSAARRSIASEPTPAKGKEEPFSGGAATGAGNGEGVHSDAEKGGEKTPGSAEGAAKDAGDHSAFVRRPFRQAVPPASGGDGGWDPPEPARQIRFRAGLGLFAFAATGLAIFGYTEYTRESRKKARHVQQQPKTVGDALIGGPFTLLDVDGNEVTNSDFFGKYMLVYFGFTYCPDICPAELEKVTEIMARLDAEKLGERIVPIFISIDPERDTPEQLKSYLEDFDSRIVGLTGTPEMCKAAAKQYRVYVSRGPPTEGDPTDYQVDHTIILYLMDRNGEFVKHYTTIHDAKAVATMVADVIREK